MKKICTLILIFIIQCLIFNVHCFSQTGPVIAWQKCLGGTSYEWVNDLRQTFDGGYIVAARSSSTDGDVSGNHGAGDIWVVKLDSALNIQWQKCYGGTDYDFVWQIQQTSDSGYVFAGTTYSNDGDVTGRHDSTEYDGWVVKIDPSGNIVWQKCLGSSSFDDTYGILQTPGGGYIVAGMAGTDDGDVTSVIGNCDFWVVKLDSGGTIQWDKCYGGTHNDWANDIKLTSDGGYIVAGITDSNDSMVTGNHGHRDYWVIKLDSIGTLQWQVCLGGGWDEESSSIAQTFDGGYMVGGEAYGNTGNISGNHGYYDYWLVKLSPSGVLQWQKCLGGSEDDVGGQFLQTADSGFVMTGRIVSNDGDISGNHGGNDCWAVKLNASGAIQWKKCLGGTEFDGVYGIQQIADGGYVLSGSTYSNNGDVSSNHGNGDCWLVKLTDNFNTISGKLFMDGNSNGAQDAGEPGLINKKVNESSTGRFAFSQQSGDYDVSVLDSGNFTVSPLAVNYYNTIPLSHNANFSGINEVDSLNDFAFQATGVFNDLCITISSLSSFITGFNSTYMINYENAGTTTLTPTIIFFPDHDITFVSANPAASSVTPDSIVWNIGPLTPYQSGSILVTVHVNSVSLGTLINSSVRIEPLAGDANPACNYADWSAYSTGSFDPNEILVSRDTVFTTELSNPPFLEYIIYFQNTGNAAAFNVRIENNITNKLNINSFEFVASSHPVSINYGAASRLMTFNFDNINLPDSNANEPASHGFIRYKIKPVSTLVAGNKIFNKAFIYFDFNPPVNTNYAITEIVLPTSVSNLVTSEMNEFVFSPNPLVTKSVLLFNNPNKQKFLFTLYDITGRIMETITSTNNEIILSKGSKPAGVYLFHFDKLSVTNEKTGERWNGKIIVSD